MMQQLVLVLIGLAALGSADRGPRTLHERTCIGQWMPAVHLHGICIIDVTGRSNYTEITRLFETENERFDPLDLDKVPKLVMQRALEEHALSRIPRQLVVNVDKTFVEPETGCSPGFYGYKGNCYTASRDLVSYSEAERQCQKIKGGLVTEFTDDIIGLLKYLVLHYIKADVYTGYEVIDDLQNHVEHQLRNSRVEVDYETDSLQYVVKGEQRGYVCVVPANVQTVPAPNHVDLPATVDDVISYDLNPPPPIKPSVERYLVDLLRYECPGNFSEKGQKQKDEIVHRADLADLDQHLPYGCHYNTSVGNVIYDLANPVNVPRELNGVCKNLARLYRIYDASTHTEYFGLHPPHRTYALGAKQPRNVFGELGYCSTKQGDCGADIPLLNAGSSKPVCYLFPSHRDLKTELLEDRPLRFVQVANRLVKISNSKNYDTNDVSVQLDPNPRFHHSQPQLLGSVLSPNSYKDLDHFCKQNLVPLYHIHDLKHKNGFLSVSLDQVVTYRQDRDHYTQEQLLGYAVNAKAQSYCGALQPLYHYQFSNGHHHLDDAYFNVIQNVADEVPHDIVAYLF